MNNSRSTKISVGMFYQIQSDLHCSILCDTPEDVHLSHLGVSAEKDNIDVTHFKATPQRGGNRTFPI